MTASLPPPSGYPDISYCLFLFFLLSLLSAIVEEKPGSMIGVVAGKEFRYEHVIG